MRKYRYSMGIKVSKDNGESWTNLPDPSEWTYQISDLDTEGGRDATGLLHRAWVATKINYDFVWNALDWEKLQAIVRAIQKPKFKLVAPDPRTFNTMYHGNYYCGDRSGKCYFFIRDGDTNVYSKSRDIPDDYPNLNLPMNAQFDLKVNFIEY